MKIPGWKTPLDIIEEAGGEDGFIREMELTSEVRDHCIRLTDLLARVEGSILTIEHYETAKLHIAKIQAANREIASMVRKLESRTDHSNLSR